MNHLEMLRQWLLTYPNWGESGPLYVDYTDCVPGAGLFPAGLEELSRQEDVLGNVTVKCRYHFALYRVSAAQEDRAGEAQWLLGFQQWVQQQSVAGLAPQFGDVPGAERLRAQKGKLKEASQTGLATYVVTLIADFTKIYGGNENVEN